MGVAYKLIRPGYGNYLLFTGGCKAKKFHKPALQVFEIGNCFSFGIDHLTLRKTELNLVIAHTVEVFAVQV
jgi:hypothetical protein